jgi:hypothetical protein
MTDQRYDIEQVAHGYRMSFSMAYTAGEAYELRPQWSEVVAEEAICDHISDAVRKARTQGLFAPRGGPVGLRVVIPRSLVRLPLGSTPVTRGPLAYPASLAVRYEIMFHVRERIESAHYLDADPSLWQQRSQLQQKSSEIVHRNVFCSWNFPVAEVADRLGDESVTICAVDSSVEEHSHVLDAVLHQGVPTIVHGPREAVQGLVKELQDREPGGRVRIGSLAGYLKERASRESDSRSIALIHDSYGDELIRRVITQGDF